MWTCPKCQRTFQKKDQPHSCKTIALADHFKGKEKARVLFDELVKRINEDIGNVKIISLPCCIHLFGTYDFAAILPKKDKLELRFGSHEKLTNPRIANAVPVSLSSYKIVVYISCSTEIDKELIDWLRRAYKLND